MKPFIHCPICGQKIPLRQEQADYRYQKQSFNVTRYFYACDKDKAEFDDEDTLNETMEQIAVKYRKRQNLPADHPLGISYKHPAPPAK